MKPLERLRRLKGKERMWSNSNKVGSFGLRVVLALAFGRTATFQIVFCGRDFRDLYSYAVQLAGDPTLTLARQQDS